MVGFAPLQEHHVDESRRGFVRLNRGLPGDPASRRHARVEPPLCLADEGGGLAKLCRCGERVLGAGGTIPCVIRCPSAGFGVAFRELAEHLFEGSDRAEQIAETAAAIIRAVVRVAGAWLLGILQQVLAGFKQLVE